MPCLSRTGCDYFSMQFRFPERAFAQQGLRFANRPVGFSPASCLKNMNGWYVTTTRHHAIER
jgi:hypothetical protein